MTFRPSDNHYVCRPVGTFKERVTKEQARHVLLNDASPIIAGRMYEWKTKHVGVGVYELWVGERE